VPVGIPLVPYACVNFSTIRWSFFRLLHTASLTFFLVSLFLLTAFSRSVVGPREEDSLWFSSFLHFFYGGPTRSWRLAGLVFPPPPPNSFHLFRPNEMNPRLQDYSWYFYFSRDFPWMSIYSAPVGLASNGWRSVGN